MNRWRWFLPALLLVPELALSDQTFTLQERFGVGHPRQVIDFDLATPQTSGKVIGPDGTTEVAAQFLEGGKKVAVQTDLPASSTKSFRVTAGTSTAAAVNPIQVSAQTAYYEITNGLTGVRVTRPGAHPQNQLAPIQGVRMRNGTWTATGPNLLTDPGEGSALSALSMTTDLVESGPLKAVVRVTYNYNRPRWSYGNQSIPAGPGKYISTITMEAGRPSILIDDDTDTQISYVVNIYNAVQQNQGRYRGHHATSVERGREPDGQMYRQWHSREAMDATRDFSAARTYYTSYGSWDDGNSTFIPIMRAWDPWCYDSGWYWMLYNSSAASSAPLVGVFLGPASRALGAHYTGPGIYLVPNDGTGNRAGGFVYTANFRGPDAKLAPHLRMSWGIFVGTKGEDLGDPYQVQNIAREMNLRGGINLNKVHRYAGNFNDPPQGYGALFMERPYLDQMINQVRTSQQFYDYLYSAEPYARPIIDMWRDPSKRTVALAEVKELARDSLDAFVNGDGIYDFRYHYWHGSGQFYSKGIFVDALLADSGLSSADRAIVKASAGLFASFLWDNDHVPLNFGENMLNAGTENMPIQHQGYRNFYALFLPTHPVLAPHVSAIRDQTMEATRDIIDTDGSEIGSSHYIGASFLPVSSQLLQLRMAGSPDPYASEPRLENFSEFYMQLMSPPEVRFGGKRKIVAIGDASTEGSPVTGVLGTGFRTANPQLSARLMGAWDQMGRVQGNYPGTTIVQIDTNAPKQDPALQSASFPGWFAAHRNSWGTPLETAFWLVAGDFYRDHRNDDRGSVVGYALGAPLSLSWGAIYYPHTPWASMKSLVLPASRFPQWNQDNPSLEIDSGWSSSQQDTFASFSESSFSQGTMSQSGLSWTRRMYSLHHVDATPLIVLRDDFTGTNAGADKIFTLNLMAQGAVVTPAGSVTPPVRLQTTTDGAPTPKPSASATLSLNAGVNRFGFTGQSWLRHATGGIDWDLYDIGSGAHQAVLGNWGHSWHPSTEQSEFNSANGRSFTEAQHILRIKSNGSFYVLLLPWRKGQKPAGLNVTQQGNDIMVALGGTKTLRFTPEGSLFQDGAQIVLASYGSTTASGGGYAIEGGPAEISVNGSQVAITAHGAAGDRILTLPGSWQATSLFTQLPDGRWRLQYTGGAPLKLLPQASGGDTKPPGAPRNLRRG